MHGQSHPWAARGGWRLDLLQHRGRLPGDGRQGGARTGAPATCARGGLLARQTLAVRHGALDAWLAAAGGRPHTRAPGRRSAHARCGPARADVAGQRMLGERAGRNEHIAMAAIVLGVSRGSRSPPSSTPTSRAHSMLVVLGGIALASLLPYLLRVFHRPAPRSRSSGPGLRSASSGVTTKLVSDGLESGTSGSPLGWGACHGRGLGASPRSARQAHCSRDRRSKSRRSCSWLRRWCRSCSRRCCWRELPESGSAASRWRSRSRCWSAEQGCLARSPLLIALMEGERVSAPSGSAPNPSDAGEEPAARAQAPRRATRRRRRPTLRPHASTAEAATRWRRTARAAAPGWHLAAREHHLADGQAAGGCRK